MNKSQLFAWYNRARAAANRGELDPARVNAALGVLQRREARPYSTSVVGPRSQWKCACPDHVQRGAVCKHMVAEMIRLRAR